LTSIAKAVLAVALLIVSTFTDSFGTSHLHAKCVAEGTITATLGWNLSYQNIETSFLKYLFYPGWGTILKNLGFNIVPPEPIGVDVFAYYSNRRTSGANGRYNYLAYHFFGLWGGILYSLIIGLVVGYLRQIFVKFNPSSASYFGYILMLVLIGASTRLIDDLLLFGNVAFWGVFFLIACCVGAKVLHLVLKALVVPLPETPKQVT